jgi:folate-binding protein YgfZ
MSGTVGIDLSQGAAAYGVLAFRGADAARFLQGQLSADIEKLAMGASTFAGFHNPQGRVIALLAVTRTSAEELFAVLPLDLAAIVAQRLSRFVLRARARVTDESTAWRVLGSPSGTTPSVGVTMPWGSRRALLLPSDCPFVASERAARVAWECADIAAGLPQVYAATSETFVAQMLNLDLLGAIAFDKGCYTGQEVIARAHYRGRVKRRMQRWHNLSGTRLEPGQSAQASDGRSLIVVRTVNDGPASQELLAVGNFSSDAPADDESGASLAAGTEASVARVSGPLSLPYTLPA